MSGTKGEMEERKVGMRRRRRSKREGEGGRFGPERIHLMKRGEKQALDRAHKGKVHRRQLGRKNTSGEERERSGGRQESRRYFISRHFLPHTMLGKKGRGGRRQCLIDSIPQRRKNVHAGRGGVGPKAKALNSVWEVASIYGQGGVKNTENPADVLYGQPLTILPKLCAAEWSQIKIEDVHLL